MLLKTEIEQAVETQLQQLFAQKTYPRQMLEKSKFYQILLW